MHQVQPGKSFRHSSDPGTDIEDLSPELWEENGLESVALAGCDVSYQSDLVRVDNLPVVDMCSRDEDEVWSALYEGCNSTCQSKAWDELAEDRLKHDGLTFPWIDNSAKSFAGLGSSTDTLEKRNLPFCIQVGERLTCRCHGEPRG